MASCSNKITTEDEELLNIRKHVDKLDKLKGMRTVSAFGRKIFPIVERFLRERKLICYGGTAINNMLPSNAQFYDKLSDLPDYDFFSKDPVKDAKKLADIYSRKGFLDVEAKSGVHFGTYKVFVNFIPIADITYMDANIFKTLSKESIVIDGIHYAPPDLLKMAMYLELSRPFGDTSRWTKVWERLNLINKYYPLKNSNCFSKQFIETNTIVKRTDDDVYELVRRALVEHEVVFFGGYALSQYSKHSPIKTRSIMENSSTFDVLSNDPKSCYNYVTQRLSHVGVFDVNINTKPPIGEYMGEHYEIVVKKKRVCIIYPTVACHSYNTMKVKNTKINIATIETILSFYLLFKHIKRPYYDNNRLMCTAEYLINIRDNNKMAKKGILTRYATKCHGRQESFADLLTYKSNKFHELKNKRDSTEYETFFLRYRPQNKYTKKKRGIKRKKTIKQNKRSKQSYDLFRIFQ